MFKTSIRYRFTLTLLVLAIAALSAVAHAQTFSVLYNFGTQSDDPTNPQYSGIVAQGRDGNLYSAAPGGTDGVGAMFKITPGGTLTVPYTFDLTVEPYGGLTLGTDGNFYGTTNSGGTANLGTVFKVAPGGKLTVLHNFTNTGDGAYPYAPPIEGADGNFYGTTTQANLANGTVYKITSSGVLTTLHTFDFAEGQYPFAPLVQGTDGNFYGTAQLGGRSTKCVGGCGTVFKITPLGRAERALQLRRTAWRSASRSPHARQRWQLLWNDHWRRYLRPALLRCDLQDHSGGRTHRAP